MISKFLVMIMRLKREKKTLFYIVIDLNFPTLLWAVGSIDVHTYIHMDDVCICI